MIYGDLHNHSTFSDGDNTIEEMIQAAINAGMDVFGISDHSHTDCDLSYCMLKERYGRYTATIRELKERYIDQIKVLGGIEFDYYTDEIPEEMDYAIGSVHYLKVGDEYPPIDLSPEYFAEIAQEYFNGDYYDLCEYYYNIVSDIVEKTNCDIIGHLDLISKYNEGNVFFDEDSPRYRKLWQKAAVKLLKYNRVFEINYGDYNRGRRSQPYLKPEMQQFIRDNGGRMIYSSDSHNTRRNDVWARKK